MWTPRDDYFSDGELGEPRYYRRGWAMAQSAEDGREEEGMEMKDLAGKDGRKDEKEKHG